MVFRELAAKALFSLHQEVVEKDEVRLMQKVVDNEVAKAFVFHEKVFIDVEPETRVCLMHHSNFITNT
jgi:hypothetical protein